MRTVRIETTGKTSGDIMTHYGSAAQPDNYVQVIRFQEKNHESTNAENGAPETKG